LANARVALLKRSLMHSSLEAIHAPLSTRTGEMDRRNGECAVLPSIATKVRGTFTLFETGRGPSCWIECAHAYTRCYLLTFQIGCTWPCAQLAANAASTAKPKAALAIFAISK